MDQALLDRILIPPDATIRTAISAIDAGAIEIALAVDGERRLIGTVTDGDIRRSLLRGAQLEDGIGPIVHRDPITAELGTSRRALLESMTQNGVDQIPLLADGRVVDVAFVRDLARDENLSDSPGHVVLMAGGRGARLHPLTESTPKPMLNVGGRPLLERTLIQIREAGFQRVFISVGYLAEVIEAHIGDGSAIGLDISYVREDRPTGTAGALRLAADELTEPFVVMNADLMTNVNLGALMRLHREEENDITVGVRQYVLEFPYGVVDLAGTRVVGLNEKPQLGFFINAGLYAVQPTVLSHLPDKDVVNMTDVIRGALDRDLRVGGFPIREYWLDIGQLSDYERAEQDLGTYLSQPE